MAPKLAMLAGCLIALAGLSHPANAARTRSQSSMTVSTSMSKRASATFQAELLRMRREHEESEAALNKSVSLEAAYTMLQHKEKAHAALSLIAAADSKHLRTQRGNVSFVQQLSAPSSLDKAKLALGQMINEAIQEYDQLHLECSVFFKKQCSLMETCREDISTSNSLAAEWRGKVLEAQKEINICEVRIPMLQADLEELIKECKRRKSFLLRDLSVVMNDISVMTTVLELTDCKGGKTGNTGNTGNTGKSTMFSQLEGGPQMRDCDHPCANSSFINVGHEGLRKHLTSLQSHRVRQLVQRSLFQAAGKEANYDAEGLYGEDPAGDMKAGGDMSSGVAKGAAPVTEWRNPPLPQQPLPADPCRGISYDTGSGGGGCIPRPSPECFNLKNKFLSIQAETIDRRDDLLDEIKKLSESCELSKRTLEGEIQMYTAQLADYHTKLAESTSGENTAAEEASMKSVEHTQLKTQMMESRTSCSEKFRTIESELCALKKIRTELFKMKGHKHAFFQDCEVGDWTTSECSVSCGGGTQTLRRAVLMPPSGGGSLCPPLEQIQRCGDSPCPIDCEVSQWSGWSACSADCGGGVTERTRRVLVHPKYEGEPCGATEETVSCNIQACDEDCDLAEWSEWSQCSKQCDSGTLTRRKAVEKAAVGRGHCPEKDDPERLERLPCNTQACDRGNDIDVHCLSKVDVVLMLDGSGSLGQAGFDATKEFSKEFVRALGGSNSKAQVSVILFSGPYYYDDMVRCAGSASGTANLDMENDCKIKMVQHFTDDMQAAEQKIGDLKWPRGTTLTASALGMANSELMLGRRGAEKIVLVITDGLPLSARQTKKAAKMVKNSGARLMFAAVQLSQRGLQYMISWSSRPTSENVLNVQSFKSLQDMDTVVTLIADICPEIVVERRMTPALSSR